MKKKAVKKRAVKKAATKRKPVKVHTDKNSHNVKISISGIKKEISHTKDKAAKKIADAIGIYYAKELAATTQKEKKMYRKHIKELKTEYRKIKH